MIVLTISLQEEKGREEYQQTNKGRCLSKVGKKKARKQIHCGNQDTHY